MARLKGRGWYDLVWFAGRHPRVNIAHLEQRMRQSGDWVDTKPLDVACLKGLLLARVAQVDIDQARSEVASFVRDRRALEVWSAEFFADVVGRIVPVVKSEQQAGP